MVERAKYASGKEAMSVNTAVAGVGGYAGGEIARLLLHHPRLRTTPPLLLGRADEQSAGQTVALESIQPQLALGASLSQPVVHSFDWELIQARNIEIAFLALPHETSRALAPEFLARGIRVIDLSGAWRLQDSANRAVYNLQDEDESLSGLLQREAVYGCPELHREQIPTARLVANPGCYATSIVLALTPLLQAGLVDLDHGVICDAKSGVSGAGKAPTAKTHFISAAENLSAYSVFGHRHTGELLEQLNLRDEQIQFTPHLLPIARGILSTIYVRLARPMSETDVETCLRNFYATSPLVRVYSPPNLPQIQYVARTNYCDLGFALAPDGKRLVLVCCLDNLLKGASGQAVQNLNLMCGWSEEEGLL